MEYDLNDQVLINGQEYTIIDIDRDLDNDGMMWAVNEHGEEVELRV